MNPRPKYRVVRISAAGMCELRRMTHQASGFRGRVRGYRGYMENMITQALADLNGEPTAATPKPEVSDDLRLARDSYTQLERVAEHWGVSLRDAIERIIAEAKP